MHERPVSRNQLDQAGSRIRRAAKLGEPVTAGLLESIDRFRAWHLETVAGIQTRLTNLFHEAAGLPPERIPITSRLKTSEAIVAKLRRTPTSLTRMQDIAGARIVVPSLNTQDLTLPMVHRLFNESVVDTKDQREEPDEHGYRAIHVIVKLDGRLAEIQLRTRWQDRWAQLVEAIDSTIVEGLLERVDGITIEQIREQVDLKHGVAIPEWLDWLRVTSDEFRKADLGQPFEVPPFPQ